MTTFKENIEKIEKIRSLVNLLDYGDTINFKIKELRLYQAARLKIQAKTIKRFHIEKKSIKRIDNDNLTINTKSNEKTN